MMSNSPDSHKLPLVESFKAFYRDLAQLKLDDMGSLYDSDITFRDPVHEIRGVNNLHAYMCAMYANLTRCRFTYLDQLVGEDSAYIKWDMTFIHPKLGRKPINVRGISQIQFTDKIVFHEDIYDMGELLYEHLPVMGLATRWLKKRLARG